MTVFLACLGVAFYCLYQLGSGTQYGHYGVSPPFLAGSSAASAAGLMWAMVLALISALHLQGVRQVLSAGLFIILLGCIYYTQSRTFLIGGVLIVICYGLSFMRGRRRFRKLVISAVAIMAVSQSFLFLTSNDGSGVSEIGLARFVKLEDGVRKRIEVVRMELGFIEPRFYVTGVGRGGYEATQGDTKRGMHSQISRTLVELGVPGILLLAIFHIALFRQIFRYKCITAELQGLRFLGMGIVVCSAVSSFGYDIWSQPRFSYGFAMAMGYILGRLAPKRKDLE